MGTSAVALPLDVPSAMAKLIINLDQPLQKNHKKSLNIFFCYIYVYSVCQDKIKIVINE
jgi:hypothetical protein